MADTEAADSREKAGLPVQSKEITEGALDFWLYRFAKTGGNLK